MVKAHKIIHNNTTVRLNLYMKYIDYNILLLTCISKQFNMKEEVNLRIWYELLFNRYFDKSCKFSILISFVLYKLFCIFPLKIFLWIFNVLQLKRKCFSSSIMFSLHKGQYLSILGIFKCLPLSIIKGWALLHILHKLALLSLFFYTLVQLSSSWF